MTEILIGKSGNKDVTIDIRLEEKEKGLALSICGNVWNHIRTDVVMCGQCVDKLGPMITKYLNGWNRKKLNQIVTIWKEWHLNDMNAGCEHQIALGWNKDGYHKHPCEPCPTCSYKYGTAWLFRPLPEYVINTIKEVLK